MVARSTQIIKELENKLVVAEKSRDAEMKKGRVAMAGLRKQLTSKEDDLAALADALKEKEMEMLKQGTKFRQALKRQQPVKKTIEQIKLEQLQLREAELEARLEDLSAVPPLEIVLNVVVSEGDREERDAPAEIEFEGRRRRPPLRSRRCTGGAACGRRASGRRGRSRSSLQCGSSPCTVGGPRGTRCRRARRRVGPSSLALRRRR